MAIEDYSIVRPDGLPRIIFPAAFSGVHDGKLILQLR
jgi:hypothetical protein